MADSFFWEDKAKSKLKVELFSKTADEQAKIISGWDDGKQQVGRSAPKYTQLRNFYDEVVKYKTELLANKEAKEYFAKKLPYIKMLNAKFAYAYGRKNITKVCQDFWRNLINEIKDYDDFIAFADFFESFMAFYRQYQSK
jgi:CRISPR-associated protein Csm2